MKKYSLSYKTAALFAFGISFFMNMLFIIILILGREAVVPSEGPAQAHNHSIEPIRFLAVFIANFIYAFLMFMINFSLLKTSLSPKLKTVVIVVVSIVGGVCLSVLISYIQTLIFNIHHPSRFISGGITRDTLVMLVVIFSSQLLYLSYKKQQIAVENEILIAENLSTRYEALKNQINPHFLFNSLNTLNSLIKVDPDKAQEYVQQFSYVFRYTLQNRDMLPLEEELKFTDAYCTLMKIRYGDTLYFEKQIDPKYLQYAILPLSIQTLVENAIKHNVASNKSPLTITISSRDDESIVVSNPIQIKKETEAGEGIGLVNLVERYKLKFQKDICINKTSATFEVTIPLIKI